MLGYILQFKHDTEWTILAKTSNCKKIAATDPICMHNPIYPELMPQQLVHNTHWSFQTQIHCINPKYIS